MTMTEICGATRGSRDRCSLDRTRGTGASARRRSSRAAPLGALAPANLAKPRPKPPFDLTGVWLHAGGPNNRFRFSPPAGFKLTPAGAGALRRGAKAQAEGKVYRDDIGQCWPAGLPRDHDARLADRDDAVSRRRSTWSASS